MTPEEAEELLFQVGSPSELWVKHSLLVRQVAKTLGSHLVVDMNELQVAALLHDIGRSVAHGLWHPWEGFRLLTYFHLTGAARVSVTHWLRGRSMRRVVRTSPGIDLMRLKEIYAEVPPRPLTTIDLIVSAADAMVAHDQVVSLAERYRDLRVRYGEGPWFCDSERITSAIFSRLSRLAGLDLERVVLDTFCP